MVKAELGGLAELIPTSLAVAQAAHESDYGKSHSARKRNNHFGLSPNGEIKEFSSPLESTYYYVETLITKRFYKKFQRYLEKGENDPIKLLRIIAPIYADDPKYVKKVSNLIKSCGLEELDEDKNWVTKSPAKCGAFLKNYFLNFALNSL